MTAASDFGANRKDFRGRGRRAGRTERKRRGQIVGRVRVRVRGLLSTCRYQRKHRLAHSGRRPACVARDRCGAGRIHRALGWLGNDPTRSPDHPPARRPGIAGDRDRRLARTVGVGRQWRSPGCVERRARQLGRARLPRRELH